MSDIAMMIAIAKKFGGGSSTPAPVVILPETEMTFDNSPTCPITTPFANKPTLGGTYKINWDGVEYTTSNVVDATNTLGEGVIACYVFGNADILGFTEMLGTNPDASANIFLALIPDGQQQDDETMYGMLGVASKPVTTTAVLSIVQTGEASADSGNAGGLYVVKATEFTGPTTINGKQTYTLTLDKGYTETVAALIAGKQDVVLDIADLFGAGSFLRLSACAIVGEKLNFAMYTGGASYLCEYAQDGTATLTLSVS